MKNISNEKKWIVKHSGIVEWFIPVIVSYELIHNNIKTLRKETFDQEYDLSNDSKNKINKISWRNKFNNSELGFLLNSSKNLSKNYFDIKTVNGITIDDDIDIFTYSFPCQDISTQGKQKGLDKKSNTRSSLLWEIERILCEMKSYNKNFLNIYC